MYGKVGNNMVLFRGPAEGYMGIFGMRISSKRAKVRAGVTNESITGKKQLIVTSSKPTDRQFIDQ